MNAPADPLPSTPKAAAAAPGLPKNRAIYVFLGIFFGIFGAHNVYSGHLFHGVVKLVLGAALFASIIGPIAVFIWSLIDVVTNAKDANGVTMTWFAPVLPRSTDDA